MKKKNKSTIFDSKSQAIGYTKEHYQVFEKSIIYIEDSLLLIIKLNMNIFKTLAYIELSKVPSSRFSKSLAKIEKKSEYIEYLTITTFLFYQLTLQLCCLSQIKPSIRSFFLSQQFITQCMIAVCAYRRNYVWSINTLTFLYSYPTQRTTKKLNP